MEQRVESLQALIPGQACLARQPILNEKNQIVAYELLFRQPGATVANVTNDTMATYSVITNAFMNIGINSVLGNKTAFINIDSDFLQSDVLRLLPKERVVFEILETVEVSNELICTLNELRKMGYKFALDDFIYHKDRAALIEYADIIKIDISLLDQDQLIEHTKICKQPNIELLAERVETINQFELCKSLGFTLFQGFFFAKPTTLSQKDIPANQIRVIDIMNKLTSDVENEEIIRAISHDLPLSYKLLKFVNSAGATCGKELTSIENALNMIGRKPLYQWLSILLYLNVGEDSQENNILFELAIYRGRLLELCGELSNKKNSHELFILGTFSCLDVLLKQTFKTIFKDLIAPILIKQALLEKSGPYFHYLELVAALDSADISKIESSAAGVEITIADLNNAQLSATAYCESLDV